MAGELRALLIDCRIALRRAGGTDAAALGARLEQAIRDIDRGALPLPGAPAAPGAPAGAGTQQVALAWQTACRGLMLSHPQLYSELRDKVMALLDQRELQDPAAELLRAEAQLRELEAERRGQQARLAELGQRAAENQSAITVLREALAEAAADLPADARGDDPQTLALNQIAWLLEQRGRAASPAAGTAARQGGEAAAEGPVPTRNVLRAVIAGQRAFSREQREWVVGEALGITGWQYTPVELLDKGDPWLAERILESASLPPD